MRVGGSGREDGISIQAGAHIGSLKTPIVRVLVDALLRDLAQRPLYICSFQFVCPRLSIWFYGHPLSPVYHLLQNRGAPQSCLSLVCQRSHHAQEETARGRAAIG